MSLSLPIEDLPRLKVSARLSPTGKPILSLTLKAGSQQPPSTSSGIYVSFERSVEDGGCSLVMNTSVEDRLSDGAERCVFSDTPFPQASTGTTPTIRSGSSTLPSVTPSPIPHKVELSPSMSPSESTSLFPWFDFRLPDAMVDAKDTESSSGFPALTENTGQGFAYDSLFSDLTAVFQTTHTGLPSSFPTTTSEMTVPGGDDSDATPDSNHSSEDVGESKRKHRNLPCIEPSCTRTFMNEHTREKHMLTHRDKPKRSFPCTMAGCSDQFSRQHDRFRHEVVKHGVETKWTCVECHGFFSSERSRNSHKCTKGGRWKVNVSK